MESELVKGWRAAGTGIWIATAVIWILAFAFSPYFGVFMVFPGVVMLLIAIVGAFAAVRKNGVGQLVAALLSLIPLGLVLLRSPSIFALIGVLNILAVGSAVCCLLQESKEAKEAPVDP